MRPKSPKAETSRFTESNHPANTLSKNRSEDWSEDLVPGLALENPCPKACCSNGLVAMEPCPGGLRSPITSPFGPIPPKASRSPFRRIPRLGPKALPNDTSSRLPSIQAGPKANLSTQRTLAASHLRRHACFHEPGLAVCHLTNPKTNKIPTNLAFDRPTRRPGSPGHAAPESASHPVGPSCGNFVTRRHRDNRLPTRQPNRPEDRFRQLGRHTRRYLGPASSYPKAPFCGRRFK